MDLSSESHCLHVLKVFLGVQNTKKTTWNDNVLTGPWFVLEKGFSVLQWDLGRPWDLYSVRNTLPLILSVVFNILN